MHVPWKSSVASPTELHSFGCGGVGPRQPDRKSGSGHAGDAKVLQRGMVVLRAQGDTRPQLPVARPDAAAVGIDDLARDAQAQPRVLAGRAIGLRPVGIEAV